ncbi:PTS sugar transporter subunit IIA [Corynebacterium cystitidis]|nr:PTS sugar transporter subunit IIA [Corynebacterium cystitidis]
MSTLNELLLPGAVNLHAPATDWREAITIAGTLLENGGAITSEYTEAMIESVETTGPYIVVAPGFAFAHARPSEAVKKTAISWVYLDEPVEFGHKKNDPVNLVVALAAVDSSSHTSAMKELATLLADSERRVRVESADTEEELREALTEELSTRGAGSSAVGTHTAAASASEQARSTDENAVPSKNKILTVCGNGLGTSLFLKNSLDKVLVTWGWDQYLDVEATDTISAKGRAKEADFLLTSGEIAATLGDVGVPVYVIEDFTDLSEIDDALRELYAI